MERDSSLDQATEGAGESSAQRAPSLQRAEAGGASPADSTQDPGGTFVLKDIVEPGQGPSPSTGALAPIREEDVSCLASEGADKVPSDLHQPDSPAIAAAVGEKGLGFDRIAAAVASGPADSAAVVLPRDHESAIG